MTSAKPAAIPPFWHRLPETLVFPFQREALSALAILTLGRLITFLPVPFLGFFVNVLLTIGLFKYAAECLVRAADGDLDAPAYSMQVTESHAWRHLGLQFIFVVLLVNVFVFFGAWAGLATAALFAYVLPAAIILLAMTRSLVESLNPLAWAETIGHIGTPYILLALLCFGCFGAGMVVAVAAESLAALPWLRIPGTLMSWFVMQYAVLACYHLMGYVVHQFADQLGHEAKPNVLPTTMRNLRADPDQMLVDETQALSDAGRNDEARRLLREHMIGRGATPLAHEHYRRLVKKDGDTAALVEHGRRYVPVLAAQHEDKRAVEILAETLALDATFQPDIADEAHRVASRATLMGQHTLALHLLNDFHQRHPKHPDVVRNLLLAARICHDRLGKAQQAQKILDLITARWPRHAHLAEQAMLAETVAATLRVSPSGNE